MDKRLFAVCATVSVIGIWWAIAWAKKPSQIVIKYVDREMVAGLLEEHLDRVRAIHDASVD